jgi:hypothetical protein
MKFNNPAAYPALPTGTKINPATPWDADFYDPDQVHYILRHDTTGKLRDFTSFGEIYGPLDNDEIIKVGDHLDMYHDQTDKHFGWFEVIGIRLENGNVKGQIPGQKMPHWVCK